MKKNETQDKAVEYCREKGGYLAAPEDLESWQEIADDAVENGDGKA